MFIVARSATAEKATARMKLMMCKGLIRDLLQDDEEYKEGQRRGSGPITY